MEDVIEMIVILILPLNENIVAKISTTHTTCLMEWLPLMKLQIAWKTVAMGENGLRLIISRSSC